MSKNDKSHHIGTCDICVHHFRVSFVKFSSNCVQSPPTQLLLLGWEPEKLATARLCAQLHVVELDAYRSLQRRCK